MKSCRRFRTVNKRLMRVEGIGVGRKTPTNLRNNARGRSQCWFFKGAAVVGCNAFELWKAVSVKWAFLSAHPPPAAEGTLIHNDPCKSPIRSGLELALQVSAGPPALFRRVAKVLELRDAADFVLLMRNASRIRACNCSSSTFESSTPTQPLVPT